MSRVLSDGKPGRYEPTDTRDRWGNRLDRCACGSTKLARSPQCKTCGAAAQVGVPKTDDPKEGASHARARQICAPGPCTFEGGCTEDGSHVHHIDGNPFNNDPANLTRLCPLHHMTVDGRLEAARKRAPIVGRLYGGRLRRG
ncbi:MAG: hypothetical protein KGL39_58310 [Patescibacteria group bacterium]|nr:hypothetical protein [Patescibacteria group bacterium]